MSKAETIDALMESAIQNFARYGFEGASLRDIAIQIGVPLSTIDRYFGSKSELFYAVGRKVWAEIDGERQDLLHAALTKSLDAPPLLSDLIHALARPIVQRALSKCESDVARISFIRNRTSDPRRIEIIRLLENSDRSIAPWIDAMMLTCPTLSRQDVAWAFSYVVGTIYSWQLIDHRYDKQFVPETERTVEEVTGDIVAFGCAGIVAIVERRRVAAVLA